MPKSAQGYIMDISIGASVGLILFLVSSEIWPLIKRVDKLEKEVAILNDKTETLEYNDRETRKLLFGRLPKTSQDSTNIISRGNVVIASSVQRGGSSKEASFCYSRTIYLCDIRCFYAEMPIIYQGFHGDSVGRDGVLFHSSRVDW